MKIEYFDKKKTPKNCLMDWYDYPMYVSKTPPTKNGFFFFSEMEKGEKSLPYLLKFKVLFNSNGIFSYSLMNELCCTEY